MLVYFLCFQLAFPLSLFSPAVYAAFVDETAARLPAASLDTYSFAVGDVNGDGYADVVVANAAQSHLLINDGTGVFSDQTAARLPALGDTAMAVAMGDVDGDGDQDIVLATTGRDRLLINDGTGHFTDDSIARLPVPVAVSMDVKLADIDGDGDLDMVIGVKDGQSRLLINDGTGHFSDDTAARLPVANLPTYSVELGDVNGDGAVDMILVNHGAPNRLYLNNGLGVFSDATATDLPAPAADSSGAALVDVDGDGDLDLAVAQGNGGLSLLINDGSGHFTDDSAARLPALSDFTIKVSVADVDSDGHPDLLLANAGQDRVLLNDGTGHFTNATDTLLPQDDQRSFGAVFLDANNDLAPDLLLATPGGQNRLLINHVAYPRIQVTTAPSYIETNTTVTISVNAFDEDGVASTTLAVNGTPVPLSGGVATYVPTSPGDYTAVVTSTDTLGNTGTRSVTFTVFPQDVTAPSVAVSASGPTPLLKGQSVNIHVTATDDRGVVSRSLTVDGVAVPLDIAGDATYVTTSTGIHTVVATAKDAAGNEGSATTTFDVLADTVNPVVSVGVTPSPVDLAHPVTVTVNASDNVAVASRTLSISGPGVPSGTDLTIDGSGQATYTPYQPGTYTLTFTATDPSGNNGVATATFDAVGTPDTQAPAVSLNIAPHTVALGGSVTLTVTATDNVGVADVSLEINGTPVVLDSSGSYTYTPPVLGTYTALATAHDATGNEGSATDTFKAVDPSTDSTPPDVGITAPAQDANLAGPTQITGTASDATLVQYTLAYAPVGSGNFTTFATGYSDVVNGALGTLDTTLLANGIYDIRLTAQDINGLVSTVTTKYVLTGQNKPGNLHLTYTDLSVPVEGIPIVVRRVYDSRKRASSLDFGHGWTVEVVRQGTYQNNRKPGDGWTIDPSGGFLSQPCSVSTEQKPHITEIRFSDTEYYQFAFQVNMSGYGSAISGGCDGTGSFTQVGGIPGATLQILGDNEVFWQNGTDQVQFGLTSSKIGETYEPQEVRLTTIDGRTYDLDLQAGVTRIGDTSGNSLSISSNGVTASSGKSVGFTRDAQGRITGITDPLGQTIHYAYDGAGDLVSMTDRAGNQTTFGYDAQHLLTSMADAEGNVPLTNEYDASGRLIAQTDGAGNRETIDTNVGANTTTVTNRNGQPTVMHYNNAGLITDATSTTGTTQFTYDDRGNKLTQTDALGHTTTYTYDANNNITSETDADGHSVSYTYDAKGHPLTFTGADGNTTSFAYDASGRPLTIQDNSGNVLESFAYDSHGNVTQMGTLGATYNMNYDTDGNITQVQGPGGMQRHYTYDANGQMLTSTVIRTVGGSPVSDTTTFTYDPNGRILTKTDPLGHTTTYTYDADGRIATQSDPRGNVTKFEYDGRGNLFRKTYADGTTDVYGYDFENRMNAHTDRANRTTFFDHDQDGNVIKVTYPDGSTVVNSFDAAGNLTSTTDPRGFTTAFQYSATNRRIKVTDPLNDVTNLSYNANGQKSAVTDPLGHQTQYQYEDHSFGVSRLVKMIFADNSAIQKAYDATGRVASRTDEAGNVTHYGYDDAGHLIQVTDPLGHQSHYTYDEAGNLISQSDADGRTTTFEYDANGHMTKRTLPSGRVETFTYDPAGNMATHIDFGGASTTYDYDAMNRLVRKNLPDGTTVEYTYTAMGKIETATDSRGITRYTYDSRDRLLSIQYPEGSSLTYTYDAAGNRTSVQGPGGTVTYTYDALNRIDTVSDPDGGVTTYTYDAAGNLVKAVYPNGTEAHIDYDSRNRALDVRHTGPGGSPALASYQYSLDPSGRRTRLTDGNGRVVDYSYDAAGRLTGENDSLTGVNTTYAYDAAGDRVSMDKDGTVTNYTYDADGRLSAAGSVTFTYDDNGNLLSRTEGANVTQFSYDALNRLISQTAPGGTVTNFEYDAAGNRVQQDKGGAVTRYLVDPADGSGLPQVVAEQDGSGNVISKYVYGNDLISQKRAGVDHYYHGDALGSTGVLTNSAGAVSDSYEYDAFGNLVGSSGTTTNDYLFAGEQYDPNLSMYYLRARYMDPRMGRFTSMDPQPANPQVPLTLNRYIYAGDDPVNMIDPTGREFGLASISISISISTVLAGIGSSYLFYKSTVKPFLDKLKKLREDIPKLKLNEDATRAELYLSQGDNNKPELLALGHGAVDQAYSTVEALVSPAGGLEKDLAKGMTLIWRADSAQWMASLPEVDHKPGHYLNCEFNDYIYRTYELELVNGVATAPFKPALEIIGTYLAYLNFLVLVSSTLGGGGGKSNPPGGVCPLPKG